MTMTRESRDALIDELAKKVRSRADCAEYLRKSADCVAQYSNALAAWDEQIATIEQKLGLPPAEDA